VLDFGVADWLGGRAGVARSFAAGPLSSNVVGTLLYMSPEQVQGLRVDGRSDLWSLALIVYECLRGAHPLRAAPPDEALATVLTPPFDVPSPAPALADWWRRATSYDPDARFATPEAFVEGLARALRVGRHAEPAAQAGRPPAFDVTPLRPATEVPLARAV
jgi:serine/threonine-protein kinase